MATFLGADTDALREMAGVFETRSRRLEELRAQMETAVMRPEVWTGPDAEAFRDRWTGTSARISDAVEGIARRRPELEDQAEQQDEASDPGSEGGGLLDSIGDLFSSIGDGLKGLLSAAKKFHGAFKAFRLFSELSALGKAGFEGLKGLINQQFIDELVDKTRGPARGIMEFLQGRGWTRMADMASGILDSGFVKGAGRFLGKALPVLDIGMGIHQMVTAEDGWDIAAGGLSTLSGGLLLAAPFCGPAAPIVAGVGLVAGGVSLAIDAGKYIVENWDSITETAGQAWDATTEFVGDAWDSTTEAVGDAWDATTDAVGDFVDDPLGAIGSLF